MIFDFLSYNHTTVRAFLKIVQEAVMITAILGITASSLSAQKAGTVHNKMDLKKESNSLRIPCLPYFYTLHSKRPKSKFIQPCLYPTSNARVDYSNFLSYSQSEVKPNSEINWPAFIITSAALGGIYTGFFIYEQRRKWDAAELPFYFNNNFGAKGIDKMFHLYAAKTQASTISNLYQFTNIGRKTSNWLGAGIALSVLSLAEIKDGKISGGGYDVYDQIANTLGTGWFYARQHSSFLRRFNIRWFYYPSEEKKLMSPQIQFHEDYNGHSFWLSMQIWDILPKKIQPYWPRFIVPAVGISLNDWTLENEQYGYLSYHLSLNPDFRYILPQESKWARALADFLNGFYIPAPAIEIYPDFGFSLIFYGQE